MSDLISREYMKSLGGACIAQRLKNGDLCPIISIDLLPSVQPRRGKWDTFLEDIDGLHWEVVRCSMCGATKPRKIFKSDDFEPNFCPNCGCRMEEGDSDDN